MRLLPAIRKLEALAAQRREVQAEYDHRAADAAFEAALRAIPDGEKMCRALARRLTGIPPVRNLLGTGFCEYEFLAVEELKSRLAEPFRVLRECRENPGRAPAYVMHRQP